MKRTFTICLFVLIFALGSAYAETSSHPGQGKKGNPPGLQKEEPGMRVGQVGEPPGQVGKDNPSKGIGPDGTPPGHGGENPGKGKKGNPPGLNKGTDVNVDTGDSTTSVSNTSNLTVQQDVDNPVQGVAPQLPWPLWSSPAPDEKYFWNQLEVEIEELTKEIWNKKKASSLVDSAKICFIRGFLIIPARTKVQCSFKGKYPRSRVLFIKTEKPDNAEFIGEVSVSGNDVKALTCIGRAMEKALENGTNTAVIRYGMNTVNKGISQGLGGTHVDSSGDAASTGLISLGSAESLKEGDPAITLICYR